MQSWTFFNSLKLLDVVSYFVHIISSKTFAALCVWPHNKALVLTLEIKLPNGFRFLKLMEFNEFKKMNLHASTQLKDHVTRREAASVVGEYGASDPVTNRCAGIFGIFTPKNASFWKQNNCKFFFTRSWNTFPHITSYWIYPR